MTDQELIEEKQREYQALAHAMQSGVAMKMNYAAKETEPKHLRVGINTSMCDHGALVKLLISKGVIGELEYFTSLCELMRNEVRMYEQWLTERVGAKVTLA